LTVNYYRDLAAALRGRRLRESEVQKCLEEVRGFAARSGTDPSVEFGDPGSYAARFPRGTTASRGRAFAGVLTVVAAVYLVVMVVTGLIAGVHLRVFGLSVPIFGSLLVCAVGLVGGLCIDRRLPGSLR
jgi:hypothetical protein